MVGGWFEIGLGVDKRAKERSDRFRRRMGGYGGGWGGVLGCTGMRRGERATPQLYHTTLPQSPTTPYMRIHTPKNTTDVQWCFKTEGVPKRTIGASRLEPNLDTGPAPAAPCPGHGGAGAELGSKDLPPPTHPTDLRPQNDRLQNT